jgi:hypothetical protein
MSGSSRIDDNFVAGTAKKDVQPVENVTAKNSPSAAKVGLKLAGIFLPVEPDPNQKANRHGAAAGNAADYARHA